MKMFALNVKTYTQKRTFIKVSIDRVSRLPILTMYLYVCMHVCTTIYSAPTPVYIHTYRSYRNTHTYIRGIKGSCVRALITSSL